MMDMRTFLQANGVDVYGYGEGRRDKHLCRGWLSMECPICRSGKLHLSYNIENDYFNCFNHGYASKWALFKAWFPGADVKALLAQIDEGVSTSPPIVRVEGEYDPPKGRIPLLESKPHVEYLRQRGVCVDEFFVARWQVEALPENAEPWYANSLFIPVNDNAYCGREVKTRCKSKRFVARPVSWLTRTILPENDPRNLSGNRYNNAHSSRCIESAKCHMYGMDTCPWTWDYIHQYHEALIVVEGVFDAWRVGGNVVATLGVNLTENQKAELLWHPGRVICFDNDEAGQERARELKSWLDARTTFGETRIFNINAKDPSEASDEEIVRLHRFAGAVDVDIRRLILRLSGWCDWSGISPEGNDRIPGLFGVDEECDYYRLLPLEEYVSNDRLLDLVPNDKTPTRFESVRKALAITERDRIAHQHKTESEE